MKDYLDSVNKKINTLSGKSYLIQIDKIKVFKYRYIC